MLLQLITTTIFFRTLPGLNKVLNEPNSVNYGTTIIETKISYFYTRIVAVILLLLLIVLASIHVLDSYYEEFIIDYTSLTLTINSIIPITPTPKKKIF